MVFNENLNKRASWTEGMQTEGRMDGRTDSPCVLQDFVPFGAAALLPSNLHHILLKQGTGTADHLLPLGCYFLLPQGPPGPPEARAPLLRGGWTPLSTALWHLQKSICSTPIFWSLDIRYSGFQLYLKYESP